MVVAVAVTVVNRPVVAVVAPIVVLLIVPPVITGVPDIVGDVRVFAVSVCVAARVTKVSLAAKLGRLIVRSTAPDCAVFTIDFPVEAPTNCTDRVVSMIISLAPDVFPAPRVADSVSMPPV